MKTELTHKDKSKFSQGMKLKKTSANTFFNRGEVIECVGFSGKTPYFTCDRLRAYHQQDFEEGLSKMPGIVLEAGEVFELL